MAEQGRRVSFADLVQRGTLEIGDGYRAKNSELGGDGPIFMRAGRLTESGWDWDGGERFYSDLAGKVKPKLAQPRDTVITTKGNSTGRTGYVPDDAPVFVYSPHLSYWRSRRSDELDSRYLRYWALSPEFRSQLKAMAHGTDMAPYLSLSDQRRIEIVLPDVGRQRAIAEVLGALDDKIAVNDRIADAALDLARALYREASLQNGENAELREIIALKYGKALREPDRRPGVVPVYGCTGQVGWHDSSLTSNAGPVVGRKGANAGWISWAPRSCWVIDTAFFVETLGDYLSSEVVFLMLESANLSSLVGDSAVPGLNRDAAHRHPVRVPTQLVAQELSERVRPLIRRSTQAQDESRILATLRDTLLPQLMSGKLRVRDAERIVEDAV
ncbi:hypothetical protein [Streptomyces sp. NPDC000888]